jgi:hypothetical protein
MSFMLSNEIITYIIQNVICPETNVEAFTNISFMLHNLEIPNEILSEANVAFEASANMPFNQSIELLNSNEILSEDYTQNIGLLCSNETLSETTSLNHNTIGQNMSTSFTNRDIPNIGMNTSAEYHDNRNENTTSSDSFKNNPQGNVIIVSFL